jgi:hypothetical protein
MKIVTVKQVTVKEYEVEGDPSDKQAIEIVQARMRVDNPLGLRDDVKQQDPKFTVREG